MSASAQYFLCFNVAVYDPLLLGRSSHMMNDARDKTSLPASGGKVFIPFTLVKYHAVKILHYKGKPFKTSLK